MVRNSDEINGVWDMHRKGISDDGMSERQSVAAVRRWLPCRPVRTRMRQHSNKPTVRLYSICCMLASECTGLGERWSDCELSKDLGRCENANMLLTKPNCQSKTTRILTHTAGLAEP